LWLKKSPSITPTNLLKFKVCCAIIAVAPWDAPVELNRAIHSRTPVIRARIIVIRNKADGTNRFLPHRRDFEASTKVSFESTYLITGVNFAKERLLHLRLKEAL